tara:strand:- start:364 stop:582 length:219 start_codon:yes stop_codon:yes gene_type:complete
MKLIFFPRLKNGNVLWECDNCGRTAQVSSFDTRAVALVCECDMTCHPQCNNRWYYDGLYHEKAIKEKYEPNE